MRFWLSAASFAACALPCSAAALRVANWNLANRPNDADDRQQLSTILNYAGTSRPIDLLVMAETDTGSAPDTASVFASVYGGTYASVVAPSDGGGDRTGFVYNTAELTMVGSPTAVGVGTLTHPTLRATFRPAGTKGADDFTAYAVHLQSGDSTANKNTRISQAQVLRADAATLGAANVIIAGDFNWQKADDISAGVGAYRTFAAAGTGQTLDVINRVGDWRNNAMFQDLFSEDPDTSLNDRFDMQLVSPALLSGSGLDYKPGSYRVVGNNGTVAPGGTITPSGTLTAAVTAAIGAFSDHLPVLADYRYDPASFAGDADLDGGVSINDFNTLAANFGKSTGQSWLTGDFDDDRGVSINDFNLLAANFGKTVAGSIDYSGLLAFAAAHNDLATFAAVAGVPEPAGFGLAVIVIGLSSRRRSHR